MAAAYRHGNAAIRLEGLSDVDRPRLRVRDGVDARWSARASRMWDASWDPGTLADCRATLERCDYYLNDDGVLVARTPKAAAASPPPSRASPATR